VVRRFQNLGIQRANPTEYVARYGTQLEDAQTLVTHARQAGVVEDIVKIFNITKSKIILFFYCLVTTCWCSIVEL
jgi:hypothetical protein